MIGEPARRQPVNRRAKRPPAMLRRRPASGRHPKRWQRLTTDPCPRECPNGSQRRLCQVRGLLPWRALRGNWYPGRTERGERLGDSWAGRGEQVRRVSLDDYCSTTSRRQSPCRLLAVRPMNKVQVAQGRSGRATGGRGPQVDGKFLRVDGERFYVRGVTYGTFAQTE